MCTADKPMASRAGAGAGADAGQPSSPSALAIGPGGPVVMRGMLICYMCGQQFGSKSFPIHVPQCQVTGYNG